MASIDPSITDKIPPDAIQRLLYIAPKVHVYQVPPLTNSKGYIASTWTTMPPIPTARIRLVETAVPQPPANSKKTATSTDETKLDQRSSERVTTNILLEDPSNGELFAAAPYVHPTSVQQTADSSRFFAIRVVGDGGRKATLGIGFEERSDAFDFGVALQDASKVLGFGSPESTRSDKAGTQAQTEEKRDYSLKEGQTIKIQLGGRERKRPEKGLELLPGANTDTEARGASGLPFLPPPPSAEAVKKQMRLSPQPNQSSKRLSQSAQELGFDDGEFGEFQ